MSVLMRPKTSLLPASADPDSRPARPSGRKARQGLDPQLQTFIGEQLRLYYIDLLREPVPDRLVALLDKLQAAEGGQS
jgi:hypothetical protein